MEVIGNTVKGDRDGNFFRGKEKYLNSIEWLSENSIRLSKPTECTPQEFEFLRYIVKDKRIVWLGENGHNIREHNMMKSKIIEFLHKEMNFTVLAFESGLAECYSANELKEEFTDEDFLKNAVYSLWATKENLSLFQLMKKENLEWVCQELYPDEKIIIWAHNLHIFKQYKTFTGFEPLGAIVSNKIKEQSYYLGLFMYEGEIHTDTGQPYKIEKPPKKSLEDYMHQVQSPALFTDFSQLEKNSDNKWIFTKTIFLESGTMPTLFVPRDQLDGALFVESVSPPEYLKRSKNK